MARILAAGLFLFGLVGAEAEAGAQAADAGSVSFFGAAQPLMQFKAETAVVLDAEGNSLFRADRKFVLGFARNAQGRVYEWRPAQRTVRLSASGQPAVWLGCDDLQTMIIACTKLRLAVQPDRSIRISETVRRPPLRGSSELQGDTSPPNARRVPNCPGDPRCPKL